MAATELPDAQQLLLNAVGTGNVAEIQNLTTRSITNPLIHLHSDEKFADSVGDTFLMQAMSHQQGKAVVDALLGGLSDTSQQGIHAFLTETNKSGDTAMMYAASYDNPAGAQALLDAAREKGVNPELQMKRADNHSALSLAVERGNLATAEMLLKAGAPTDQTFGPDNEHLLDIAVGSGNADMITMLVKANPALANARESKYQWSELEWASHQGNSETVSAIINGLTPEQRTEMLSQQHPSVGRTTLHYAVEEGHSDIAGTLLEGLSTEQKIKLLGTKDQDGNTPLTRAAYNNKPEILETLLKDIPPEQRTALLSQQDKYGKTALHHSAWEGHHEIISKLFEGLSPEQKISLSGIKSQNGDTPLILAAYNNKPEAIEAFLKDLTPEQRVEVLSQQHAATGMTALHYAPEKGNAEIINKLLEGLSPAQTKELLAMKSNSSRTPLDTAASAGHGDVIKTMINAGAEFRREKGSDALWYAAISGKSDAIDVLTKAGEHINSQKDGYSVLHMLAMKGSEEANKAIVVMAQKGADFDLKTEGGKTLEDLVKDNTQLDDNGKKAALAAIEEGRRIAKELAEKQKAPAPQQPAAAPEAPAPAQTAANNAAPAKLENGGINIKELNKAGSIEKLFAVLDDDNDGKITADELRRAMQKTGLNSGEQAIKAMLDTIDKTRDGSISLPEFRHAVNSHGGPEKLLENLDANRDGKITKHEAEKPFREPAAAPQNHNSGNMREGAGSMIAAMDKNGDKFISNGEFRSGVAAVGGMQNFLNELDRNGDGKISKGEAAKALRDTGMVKNGDMQKALQQFGATLAQAGVTFDKGHNAVIPGGPELHTNAKGGQAAKTTLGA